MPYFPTGYFPTGAAASGSDSGEYPTVEEVSARLTEMGLTPPSDATILAMRDAAIGAWENATGFHPYLADAEDSEWRFLPNGTYLLDFAADGGPGGFVAVTEITFDVTYAYPGGNAQTAGRDYTLQPANHPARNRAFWYAKTPAYLGEHTEASIVVVGRAGGAATIEPAVWEAIMQEACARVVLLQQAGSGNVIAKKLGAHETRYAQGGSFAGKDAMTAIMKMTATDYRRPRIA